MKVKFLLANVTYIAISVASWYLIKNTSAGCYRNRFVNYRLVKEGQMIGEDLPRTRSTDPDMKVNCGAIT